MSEGALDDAGTVLPAGTSVGIFWGVEDTGGSLELAIDKTPLTQAEAYGDFLTHPRGHYDVWEGWRRIGFAGLKRLGLPTAIPLHEYEECPRGRIVYRRPSRDFVVYADRRLQRPDIIQRIVQTFGLIGQKYDVQSDTHYR